MLYRQVGSAASYMAGMLRRSACVVWAYGSSSSKRKRKASLGGAHKVAHAVQGGGQRSLLQHTQGAHATDSAVFLLKERTSRIHSHLKPTKSRVPCRVTDSAASTTEPSFHKSQDV